MKKISNMTADEAFKQEIVEEMRLAMKELGWALVHIKNIYTKALPEEKKELEDANQLDLFVNAAIQTEIETKPIVK